MRAASSVRRVASSAPWSAGRSRSTDSRRASAASRTSSRARCSPNAPIWRSRSLIAPSATGPPPAASRTSSTSRIRLSELRYASGLSGSRPVTNRRSEMKLSFARTGSLRRRSPRRSLTRGISAASRRMLVSSALRPAPISASLCEAREARRSTRSRSSREASRRWRAIVAVNVAAVTPGWPSMSPPAQLEKRIGAAWAGCAPNQCSSSRTSSGTVSNSTLSKKCRLRLTSSSTCGRARRTSAVCHQSASDSRMRSTARSCAARPSRSSSSTASCSLTSDACCMTDQRVASVGCAVSVRSSRRPSSARAEAFEERSRSRAAASAIDSRCGGPPAARS